MTKKSTLYLKSLRNSEKVVKRSKVNVAALLRKSQGMTIHLQRPT